MQSRDRLIECGRGAAYRGKVFCVGGLPEPLHRRVHRRRVLQTRSGAFPDPIQCGDIGQHQTWILGFDIDRKLACPQCDTGQIDIDHRLVQQPQVELILGDAQRGRLGGTPITLAHRRF